jgi:transcriptional regulator with XRE-family HTH domain
MSAEEFWSRVNKLQGEKNDAWLSAQLGVRHSTVSTWKRMKRVPKDEMLRKIAKVFDVRIEFLLNGWEYIGTAQVEESNEFDPFFIQWVDAHESLISDLMMIPDDQLGDIPLLIHAKAESIRSTQSSKTVG